MKKILLIAVTTLIAISTGVSLEPMKVAFVYTAGTPTSVRVQMADNTSSSLFVGENLTSGITPSGSGIVLVNVQDHAGSGTTWSDYNASDITTYHTLDIYVNGSLYAQYRLDALILAQAQASVFDNDGNFNPTQEGASLGTDGNRWSELYVEGNTVHIGPALGNGTNDELSFSYDDATNTATMTVAGEDVFESTDDVFTFNKRVSQVIAGNNTAFGNTAFNGTSTGASNTAVGYLSMSANTSGDNNTAIGTSSLRFNTSGTDNTAVGTNALIANTTGNNNTATGKNALLFNTSGFNNTANGINSLYNNNTGNYNTANGEGSLFNNTAGNNNTAIGRGSLFINSTGSFNTAAGDEALRNNATGNNNLSLGVRSGYSITSGSNNVFLGNRAGENASQKVDATNSIAIGANSFTTADNQVVIGNNSILENNFHGRIEQRIGPAGNTALGTNALNTTLSGDNNTAVGVNALDAATSGGGNTAIGYSSLSTNSHFGSNTSVGANSLQNSNGHGNTALGRNAGNDLTTGTDNLFVGYNAGENASQKVDATNSIAIGANSFTTADNQVVIGNSSITETNLQGVLNVPQHAVIDGLTIGQGAGNDLSNTALGNGSLQSNTTGTRNTATGTRALRDNLTGERNTANGFQALMNNTGSDNSAFGNNALLGNTTGSSNTAVGESALSAITTGSTNTAVGFRAGQAITNGTENVFVGDNAGNNGSQKVDAQNSIAIGANTFTTADNQVVIGNNSITETQMRGVTLMDLAGGGTQNLQIDNTGKIITGGGGGGGSGLPEVTVLTKSSDQTINTTTYVNITDITATLDANSVYKLRAYLAFTGGDNNNINVKLEGVPSSGVVMFDSEDGTEENYMPSNSNEFIDDYDSYTYTPLSIDGIFQTGSSSSTFNLQLKMKSDPFDITSDSFIILTKIK